MSTDPKPGDLRLQTSGHRTMYTEEQLKSFHKLPPGVIINHILPFVGGVRSKEAKLAGLQQGLKLFMQIADRNISSWFHHSKCGSSHNFIDIYNPALRTHPERYRHYEDWWVSFKRQIDQLLSTEYRGRRYKAADLNFTTAEWLKHWVEIDEIPMQDFALVPLETWLFYAEIYRPTLLVDHK